MLDSDFNGCLFLDLTLSTSQPETRTGLNVSRNCTETFATVPVNLACFHPCLESPEKVYTIMCSDYIQIRVSVVEFTLTGLLDWDSTCSSGGSVFQSEVDIYEAALRWLNFDFYKRKIYMQQLMECPRWVHMTVEDMVKVRSLDSDFFHHKEVCRQVSHARWYQDLQKRGVIWNDYQVPPKRFM
ncbi:hypothetical protein RvY_14363 [Ramazzottius varieornatus]|uniref:BACK domain-containing protein n=1 Tax=Ramazzottius varieornatus TaxID=947166 RepID=A0A1D1VT05_RAMVA|nr:hypothetical protein RvY_14363 [Ramazzottius varieornatus]